MSDLPSNEKASDNETPEPKPEPKPTKQPARTGSSFQPLRIWPLPVLLILLWIPRWVAMMATEVSFPVMMANFMGPPAVAAIILLWWGLLSRATWKERIVGLVGFAAIAGLANLAADKSVAGLWMLVFGVPWGISLFAVALIGSSRTQSFGRTWLALGAAAFGFGMWDLVRADEVLGDFKTTYAWRWEPTAEDRLLENLENNTTRQGEKLLEEPLGDPEWPEFRGPNRDSVRRGVILAEDWKAKPPKEIWRIDVGPGWSSFSVAGNRLFTQEQRGEDEVVACYDARDGKEVWLHQYKSRFWEAIGGAGPRATPTLSDGKLFALGANGILHRLDPITGEKVWEADISKDAGRKPPTWGFSSSPLVTHGHVIVHAGGEGDKGLLAYDIESGALRWNVATGDHSYSSAHLAQFDEKTGVMIICNQGLTVVDPQSGNLLGKHEWKVDMYRVLQPLILEGNSMLIGTGMGSGIRRVDLTFDGKKITGKDRWTAERMNPQYNDYVAHKGYLYGFDSNVFACVDLETGERKWKRGRYGFGQVLLLPDGDQLLVISEEGELVLLRTNPEKHTELTRHRVLDDRTWNHPVLIGNLLYVRNGSEAACFEMALKQ